MEPLTRIREDVFDGLSGSAKARGPAHRRARCAARSGLQDPLVSRRVGWTMAGALTVLVGLALAAPGLGMEWPYDFCSAACHQRPERCYGYDGHPMALCVRCLWLYGGLALGHALFCEWRLCEPNARKLLLVSLGLLLVDVASEALGLRADSSTVRALTGLLAGLACSWYTLRGLTELFRLPQRNLMLPYEPNHT